jgi:hypothetical protein
VAELRNEPTEIEKTFSEYATVFTFTLLRESERKIKKSDPPVMPVTEVEQPANTFTQPKSEGERQKTEERKEEVYKRVLESCCQPPFLTCRTDNLFLSLLYGAL